MIFANTAQKKRYEEAIAVKEDMDKTVSKAREIARKRGWSITVIIRCPYRNVEKYIMSKGESTYWIYPSIHLITVPVKNHKYTVEIHPPQEWKLLWIIKHIAEINK